ncbi:MAG: CPBP family intramembrane metalloprotease [Caulobacteraceae bacterium]|nr:CPBP family intramembrane metalloprotease [Caulobacteraceae bacterium]
MVFAAVAAAISLATGLAHWSPRDLGQFAFLALRAFFIPALGEELMFRAALVPAVGESKNPAFWIVVSTLLFGLWHVADTVFLPGSASTWLRFDFLALAMLLGLLCAILRFRSGSIWTAVALHWIIVVAWQGWFGGPAFGRVS